MTSTEYQAKLDELIPSCDFEPEAPYSRTCAWCGKEKGTSIHTLKAALTKLTEEVVDEVIGQHKPANDDDAKYNFPEHYYKVQNRYELSVEQHTTATNILKGE